MGRNYNEVASFSSSWDDEGLIYDNEHIDKCIEPSHGCAVDEFVESLCISFENLIDDDSIHDFRITDFHDPCKEYYWHTFGDPCFDTSSMESEGMLDDDYLMLILLVC